MPWPDIFFKAKKRPEPEVPPPLPSPTPEVAKAGEPPPSPAPSKPPPLEQVPRPASQPLPPPALKAPSLSARSTRTLPVVHGVILRPPARPATGRLTIPSTSSEPMKNIEQLMAEADPVKTLSQTGSVRMLKRLTPEAPALRPPGTPPPIRAEQPPLPAPAATPAPVAVPVSVPAPSAVAPGAVAPAMIPPKATATISPWPSFQAKNSSPIEVKKPDPIPAVQIRRAEPLPPLEVKKAEAPAAARTISVQLPRPAKESTPVPRPAAAVSTPFALRPPPPALPPMISIGSVAKRKAKLADVARLVLPPKREETGPLPPAPAPASTVVPPSFPVASTSAHASPRTLPKLVLPPHVSESPFMERTSAKPSPDADSPAPAVTTPPVAAATAASFAPMPVEAKAAEPVPMQPQLALDTPVAEVKMDAPAPVEPPKAEPAVEAQPLLDFVPKTDFEAPKLDPSLVFDPATLPAKAEAAGAPAPAAFESVPQVDPEARQPVPKPEAVPRLDPEAHKPPPGVVEPAPVSAEIAPVAPPGTREFHLTNGERVAGVVLSETPDTVYIEHATLGVLTIPRGEIATRLVEIILINGDRIVGNIMAETADMLYVRHASLGMLSVPRAQRSKRVVEAILKNGDRILGEVLTETETFTVIRSATLGTVTVPHDKLNMLNRKIEQIEMKALPPAAAQLPDTGA